MKKDTYAEQGFSQFPLNFTENLIQSCLRNISICLEMPTDAKNYISFVVDKFCKLLHTHIFFWESTTWQFNVKQKERKIKWMLW